MLRSVQPEQLESAIVPVVAYSDNGYYERLDDSAQDLFAALRRFREFLFGPSGATDAP